jgi:phosphate transport system permease protein
MGSIWVCAGCAVFFLPLGCCHSRLSRGVSPKVTACYVWLTDLLQLNITNLAGVPSVVYGILGFDRFFRDVWPTGNDRTNPILEIGSSFRRQYVTEGMQVVFIPVAGRNENTSS